MKSCIKAALETLHIALIMAVLSFGLFGILHVSTPPAPTSSGIEL